MALFPGTEVWAPDNGHVDRVGQWLAMCGQGECPRGSYPLSRGTAASSHGPDGEQAARCPLDA